MKGLRIWHNKTAHNNVASSPQLNGASSYYTSSAWTQTLPTAFMDNSNRIVPCDCLCVLHRFTAVAVLFLC